VGFSLYLILGYDEFSKAGGREAFFAPFLGSALDRVLPETDFYK
jgi:hypothetical protein